MNKTITTEDSLINMSSGRGDPQEFSYDPCEEPSYDILILSGVCTCISLCGLVGNGVVLWLLGFRMKQNPFTVYVLNLAIADFSLLLVLLLNLSLHFISPEYCISYYVFFLINSILFVLFLFCYFAGMYLLTAMSMERCLAALFPLWYRCHRPKHLSGILCGVLWALAALFATLMFTSCFFGESCHQLFYVLSSVNFVLFSFIPLLSNLALFIKLRCGSQRRHPGKLYVAVLLSVTFLFILGFPFSVETFLAVFYPRIYYVSCVLASLNSSINPVIYFLVGSCRRCQFQCSIRAAFQRLFEEGATSEERSQVPGDAVMETSV
ncbi:mas-related G-protein coupled receptor member X1-like [Indicator indicator]|uniref:mas-related G-protein coupled receptor member X1-like n=1 Tax=Indicator indicator TaxID=1002788 RepID=UPI0023E00FD6|nr:mas-related G-protein coupled receptor member X1-like [Indicator indicator]